MRRPLPLVVATLVATTLAAGPAWAHTFPPVRTVVVQVERCEVVLLVGYRPGTGEAAQSIIARAITTQEPRPVDALRDVLAVDAMASLTVTLDGKPLPRTSVRAKAGIEPGGLRPMVVLLVTYALPPGGGAFAVTSHEPHSTRISWQDHDSGRIQADELEQDRWFDGVASFLLTLRAPGGSACGPSPSSR